MEKLSEILRQCMNRELVRITISNRRHAGEGRKVTVKPYEEKGKVFFQFTEYKNDQVFHKNLTDSEAVFRAEELLREEYKQIEVQTTDIVYTAFVNKKGKASIRSHRPEAPVTIELKHNRKKRYILPEGEKISFLIELGVQTEDGKIVDKKYKKFRQINRFLEFVRDVLPELPRGKKLTILDFGCGKSYLTFAMYHYLKVMKGYDVRMIGLDLKADVIERCGRLAEKLGYSELTFCQGDIGSYEGVNSVDMVVSLHACDTATDFALYKAVRWDAKVILSVPCCQHELNGQISADLLRPVLRYGILKERISALLTDGLRAELLEQQGYSVQLLEFIDMEHTPKNILIRAVKTGKRKTEDPEYDLLCDKMNLHGTLEELLKGADIIVERKATECSPESNC